MRGRRARTPSVTSAPEGPAQELQRRQRRYAILAAVFFVSCFTAAALLHMHTVLAVALCVVAIVTLVLAVVGANVRRPRRRAGPASTTDRRRQLP